MTPRLILLALLILLAASSLYPFKAKALAAVEKEAFQLFEQSDTDRDGTLAAGDFPDLADKLPRSSAIGGKVDFTMLDINSDKRLDRHERAMHFALATTERWGHSTRNKDSFGQPLPVAILGHRRTPTLHLAGARDHFRFDLMLNTLFQRSFKHPAFGWKIYPGLGHYFGPLSKETVTYGGETLPKEGTIDPRVPGDIVNWLKKRSRKRFH